jgi:hypothetical protein
MAKASYTTHCSPTPRFTHPRRDCGPHQFRTRNDLNKPQRTQPNSNENVEESTKPTIVLPLITVWLQVRVLPGPPKINHLAGFISPPLRHRTRNAYLHCSSTYFSSRQTTGARVIWLRCLHLIVDLVASSQKRRKTAMQFYRRTAHKRSTTFRKCPPAR